MTITDLVIKAVRASHLHSETCEHFNEEEARDVIARMNSLELLEVLSNTFGEAVGERLVEIEATLNANGIWS